jgi:hypothetical protein
MWMTARQPSAGSLSQWNDAKVMKTNSQRNLLAIARGDRGLLVVDGEATAVESVRSLLNESFGKKTIAMQNLASGK